MSSIWSSQKHELRSPAAYQLGRLTPAATSSRSLAARVPAHHAEFQVDRSLPLSDNVVALDLATQPTREVAHLHADRRNTFAAPVVPMSPRASTYRLHHLPSVASLIGSHATTIRNNMPVYDGDSEVLVQARHAPDGFARFANHISAAAGTQWALFGALGVVGIWLACGYPSGWSNTWQLVINTGTTIVTFWMMFVIQNTQNREAATMSLKIDQLMRVQHEMLELQRTMLPEDHPLRQVPPPPMDFPAEA